MLVGFMGLGTLELIILIGIVALIVLAVRNHRPQVVSCVKCSTLTTRGGYSAVQILCCVLLFPIGLLSLLGGRKSTVCTKCGNTWIV